MNPIDPVLEDGDKDLLLGALSGATLPAARKQALWQRVVSATSADKGAGEGFVIVPAEHDDWRQLMPGLRIKPLRVDTVNRTQTSLWKLDPGTVVPGHSHHADEECLILEGSLRWDGKIYGRGDYVLALPGGEHTPFDTPDGALLLIRSELTEPLRRLFAA